MVHDYIGKSFLLHGIIIYTFQSKDCFIMHLICSAKDFMLIGGEGGGPRKKNSDEILIFVS